MFAEIVDSAGDALVRLEADISNNSDLSALISAVNRKFEKRFPRHSIVANAGKAGHMMRAGAVVIAPDRIRMGEVV